MATTTRAIKQGLETAIAGVRATDDSSVYFVNVDDVRGALGDHPWTSAAERTFEVLPGAQEYGAWEACSERSFVGEFLITVLYPETADRGALYDRVAADRDDIVRELNDTGCWVTDTIFQEVTSMPAIVEIADKGLALVLTVTVEYLKAT